MVAGTALLASCKSNASPGSGSKGGSDDIVDLKGRTVKIFSQWELDPNKSDDSKSRSTHALEVARWNEIQKEFNCTIQTIVPGDWSKVNEQYVTAINSGDVLADAACMEIAEIYPTYIVNGLFASCDSYFDTTDKTGNGVWDANVSKQFSYNGKCYGVAVKSDKLPTNVVFFNKRIFSQYDQLKQYNLYQLVKDKQWTWDKYREIAKAATIYASDGTVEVMGVAGQGQPGSTINTCLITSNGNFFVDYNNGQHLYSLDQDSALAAMNLTYDMAWIDKSVGITGAFSGWTGSQDAWQKGKCALFFGELWQCVNYKKTMADDQFGVLPIPMGPNEKDYVNDYSKGPMWGLVPGAKDPDKIAKLVEALVRPQPWTLSVEKSMENRVFDQDSLDILVSLSKHATCSYYQGYSQLVSYVLWSDYGIPAKTPPATVAATRKAIVQKDIDNAWTPRKVTASGTSGSSQ